MLVLEKSYIADSGGRGEYRGGMGQRVRLRKLHDDDRTTMVSIYPEGVANPIEELFGGEAGCEASGKVLNQAGDVVRDCGTGALVELQTTQEIVELVLAGGSGFGDPAARALHDHQHDLSEGIVTRFEQPDHPTAKRYSVSQKGCNNRADQRRPL